MSENKEQELTKEEQLELMQKAEEARAIRMTAYFIAELMNFKEFSKEELKDKLEETGIPYTSTDIISALFEFEDQEGKSTLIESFTDEKKDNNVTFKIICSDEDKLSYYNIRIAEIQEEANKILENHNKAIEEYKSKIEALNIES